MGATPEAPSGEAPRKRVMRKRTAAETAAAEPAKPKRTRKTKETAGERKTTRAARKAPAHIPPILLETERPETPSVSGPGQRYALGPSAPVEAFEDEGQLPESYGTEHLLLAARDPHWLYAHWDLTREQQRAYNARSRDQHLILRVYLEAPEGAPIQELHVQPESRHWFVHVPHGGRRYVAQLGFYQADGRWFTISTSGATITPPDTASADTSAAFATIPIEVPMSRLLSLVKGAARESAPLAEALERLRRERKLDLPSLKELTSAEPSRWTPEQERALAQVISMDEVRRVWMGSMEITELIRRQAVQEMASMQAAGAAVEWPTSPGAVSSPAPLPAEKGFWFAVNAELVVYGATEPDARVTIAGREIRLRPDGTFSCRFALPDGNFELPIVAVSADRTDGRAAEMNFSRQTRYSGEVGMQAQDPSLNPPVAALL